MSSNAIADGRDAADYTTEWYRSRLSKVAAARKPDGIRELFHLMRRPGVINMLAGKPNPDMFPFIEISLSVQNAGTGEKTNIGISAPAELDDALNYGPTTGLPALIERLEELQGEVHGRTRTQGDDGWRISVGAGSQDLIGKAFCSLLEPGDPVLIESPVYAGVLPRLKDLNANIIDVDSDVDGTSAAHLRKILSTWKGERRPRVLYTVPVGNNPTGVSTTLARKREILRLAYEFDFLILEDDPYFFLAFDHANRVPSYLSLDSRRVLRFDSFSKVLSAGLRVGYASGPTPILDAIDLDSTAANLQPSSTAQAIVLALLQKWGTAGFLKHCEGVADFYRLKCDAVDAVASKHLAGLAEWTKPVAGMFLWVRLLGVEDTDSLIRHEALEKGVLALPGSVFFPSGKRGPFARFSFSTVSVDDAEEGFRRLRDCLVALRGDRA